MAKDSTVAIGARISAALNKRVDVAVAKLGITKAEFISVALGLSLATKDLTITRTPKRPAPKGDGYTEAA